MPEDLSDEQQLKQQREELIQLNTLEAVEQWCWQHLYRGVVERNHPLHLMAFASQDAEGVPTARFVVLRICQRSTRMLGFNTDVRSPKYQQALHLQQGTFLFYDSRLKVQLRVQGTLTAHHADAVADEAWEQVRLFSRRCYLSEKAPGAEATFYTAGYPDDFLYRDPTQEESESGRPNFATVRMTVLKLDWYFLHVRGHRRACFSYGSDGNYDACWAYP